MGMATAPECPSYCHLRFILRLKVPQPGVVLKAFNLSTQVAETGRSTFAELPAFLGFVKRKMLNSQKDREGGQLILTPNPQPLISGKSGLYTKGRSR